MNQEIAQLGAPVLRKTTKKVTDFSSKKLTEVIELMQSTLAESEGIGIAAPQIFESVSIIIIASKPNTRYPNAPLMQPEVMINPSFKNISTETKKDWEGCLSIPSIRALVPRYQKIQISYQDIKGVIITLNLEDFVARVFQHEYDHLQGLVYLDRVENNADIISETEFFKLIAI